ncbi:MAG: hypothetical protein HOF52_04425 [Thiotrichales bacterium]|nr:hypothetical protein [Thiotrichales bacterium]
MEKEFKELDQKEMDSVISIVDLVMSEFDGPAQSLPSLAIVVAIILADTGENRNEFLMDFVSNIRRATVSGVDD